MSAVITSATWMKVSDKKSLIIHGKIGTGLANHTEDIFLP
jgi:hypothetical protein